MAELRMLFSGNGGSLVESLAFIMGAEFISVADAFIQMSLFILEFGTVLWFYLGAIQYLYSSHAVHFADFFELYLALHPNELAGLVLDVLSIHFPNQFENLQFFPFSYFLQGWTNIVFNLPTPVNSFEILLSLVFLHEWNELLVLWFRLTPYARDERGSGSDAFWVYNLVFLFNVHRLSNLRQRDVVDVVFVPLHRGEDGLFPLVELLNHGDKV